MTLTWYWRIRMAEYYIKKLENNWIVIRTRLLVPLTFKNYLHKMIHFPLIFQFYTFTFRQIQRALTKFVFPTNSQRFHTKSFTWIGKWESQNTQEYPHHVLVPAHHKWKGAQRQLEIDSSQRNKKCKKIQKISESSMIIRPIIVCAKRQAENGRKI